MTSVQIKITAPLPEGDFERAEAITRIKPHIDQLQSALSAAFQGIVVETRVGEPPKKTGRKPRSKPTPVSAAA